MTAMLRSLVSLRAFAARFWPRPSPASLTDPPRDLRFEYGAFPFCRAVRYRVKKGWVIRTVNRAPAGQPPPGVRQRQPAPGEWLDFWRTIAPLRIWDWRRSYFEPPPAQRWVLDGRGWHFSCRFGGRRMKSFGGSFYPELWRPADTTVRRDSIALLKAALDKLLLEPGTTGRDDS